jgi:RNA polymerase sigma factor (sigma-70 family)
MKYNWTDIYKENAPRMLGICRRYVKSIAVAEDIVQEAFITAIKKEGTYMGLGSFEGWLRRIVINTALGYLRKNREIATDSVPEQIESSILDTPADEPVKRIIESADFNEQQLLAVIDRLPDHHRAVFNLYVIDNFKHQQIGKMLNISTGTSKSHLSRARKKVQEALLEMAKEKVKTKKKNEGVLFSLAFFPVWGFIDQLYRNTFDAYSVTPAKEFDLSGYGGGSNVGLFTPALKIAMGTIGLTGIIFMISFFIQGEGNARYETEESTPVKKPAEMDSVRRRAKEDMVDSLKKTSEKTVENKSKTPKRESITTKKPLVIRKNIVVRDTVYKAD